MLVKITPELKDHNFIPEFDLFLQKNKDKLNFEYELISHDKATKIDGDKLYIPHFERLEIRVYEDELDFNKVLKELNIKWQNTRVYILDLLITPEFINMDSNRSKTHKLKKITIYSKDTFEPKIRILDSSKLYRHIMVQCFTIPGRK